MRGGYVYEEGGIPSPDGHCRTFDKDARGTVAGSGAAILVLKRLSEAIGDRDRIWAIIKGTAINNDGAMKVGFTAPSVHGQAAVIEEALSMAEVHPDTIAYLEAHGTGTSIGDPIEIAGLAKAFGKWTKRKQYCPIGSVKSNIGHLDAAAGAAGIVKTVLSLNNRRIPPSLNFKSPNPYIDFANSPFYVNAALSEWPNGNSPRRAGVSSFGLGGTNAHIVLEEAPATEPSGPSRPRQLLALSAKTDTALEKASRNLARHLEEHPEIDLADVAYTLHVGRKAFDRRRIVVCGDREEAIKALKSDDPVRAASSSEPAERQVVFMFPGQGAQYVRMGTELYETEPVFRKNIDRCSEILRAHADFDLLSVLYPKAEKVDEANEKLNQTVAAQPALFVVEYALAMLWISWGARPAATVGHSVGEYVSACLAGVVSLEDVLPLVAARGRLMQAMPPGAMLAVALPEKELRYLLDDSIDISGINTPSLCVVSGETESVADLERRLVKDGVQCRRIRTSHAFHSRMMAPMLKAFSQEVRKVGLRPPRIPFLSNTTGTWITPEQSVDPNYWVAQLRQPVRFADCVEELFKTPRLVLLEAGPGNTLASLAMQHPDRNREHVALSSIRHPKETKSDSDFILNTLGRLWLKGVPVDWAGFYANEKRRRVGLPSYPFERKRYWIEPAKTEHSIPADERTRLSATAEKKLRIDMLSIGEESPDRERACAEKAAVDDLSNEPQRSVSEIWRNLLGVDHVGLDDNFFELGGNSLLAGRLFTQIEKVFGKKISPSSIFQASTIREISELLVEEKRPADWTSLVKIKDGSSKETIFCLPGNMSNVFTDLKYLGRHLGNGFSLYGLQDGLGHPSNVARLAAHFIEDIRQIQPSGPYRLAGLCGGGAIAFEMARQLTLKGEEISFLGLIEPAALSSSYWDAFLEIYGRIKSRSGYHLKKTSEMTVAEKAFWARLKLKLVFNILGIRKYKPEPFPGFMHLFLTEESLRNTRGNRFGWSKFAVGGVRVHEIPGTHNSITGFDGTQIDENHMHALAEEIERCLESDGR